MLVSITRGYLKAVISSHGSARAWIVACANQTLLPPVSAGVVWTPGGWRAGTSGPGSPTVPPQARGPTATPRGTRPGPNRPGTRRTGSGIITASRQHAAAGATGAATLATGPGATAVLSRTRYAPPLLLLLLLPLQLHCLLRP